MLNMFMFVDQIMLNDACGKHNLMLGRYERRVIQSGLYQLCPSLRPT